MLKRTIAAAAAAGVLALVPTAAFAYGETPGSIRTESQFVGAGGIIPMHIFANTGDVVFGTVVYNPTTGTFSFGPAQGIAGTITSESYTIAAGETGATFPLTVPEDYVGEVELTSYVNGVAVDTATVTVVAAEDASTGELSSTGFDNVGLVAGAGVLLVAGAGAVALGARRRGAAQA